MGLVPARSRRGALSLPSAGDGGSAGRPPSVPDIHGRAPPQSERPTSLALSCHSTSASSSLRASSDGSVQQPIVVPVGLLGLGPLPVRALEVPVPTSRRRRFVALVDLLAQRAFAVIIRDSINGARVRGVPPLPAFNHAQTCRCAAGDVARFVRGVAAPRRVDRYECVAEMVRLLLGRLEVSNRARSSPQSTLAPTWPRRPVRLGW
jgi:hypothetical protein